MKQLNFTVFFVIALALVLFALENTTSANIQFTKGLKLEAPIAVELILAMGVGALLAWVFSVWAKVQNMLELNNKNRQIETLQEKVTELTVEVEERKRLVAASTIDVEVEGKTKQIGESSEEED